MLPAGTVPAPPEPAVCKDEKTIRSLVAASIKGDRLKRNSHLVGRCVPDLNPQVVGPVA
jgi:hypothetical protein